MFKAVKQVLKNLPVVGPTLRHTMAFIRGKPVSFSSSRYWENRYRAGGNSGAGSTNRLAQFKAEILNGFIQKNEVTSIIEFGCGDGAQLELANYPQYIGIDVSEKAISLCRQRFYNDQNKKFFLAGTLQPDMTADLTLSMDVIYHLIEDSVFEAYMADLFKHASRYVIIYSSNDDKSWPAEHVRHRKFTDWVEQNTAGWNPPKIVKNIYPFDITDQTNTSFADFYIYYRT